MQSKQKITKFEDIYVWKEARILSEIIYKLSNPWKDYGLKDQVRRSSVSVVSNIAEGFERGSKKEFLQFLYVAKGSVGEVRAQLYLAGDLGYISQSDCEKYIEKSRFISILLNKFIKSYKKKGFSRKESKN